MNRLNYFYLPNSVFDYGLSANEIGVLAVLYASARNNIVQISQKTIAEKLGIKKKRLYHAASAGFAGAALF